MAPSSPLNTWSVVTLPAPSVRKIVPPPSGPGTPLRPPFFLGERLLDNRCHVEPPACLVRLGPDDADQLLLVERPPAQRELQALRVRLDEPPEERSALGITASARDGRETGDPVADEPVSARLPGDSKPVDVCSFGRIECSRLQLDVAERVERARRAEAVTLARRELGGLAEQSPAT